MPYLFSASAGAFFHTDVPYKSLPADVVEISDDTHEEIMTKVSREGMTLQADADGLPMAVAPAAGEEETKDQAGSEEAPA
ncbi:MULTISPECIES: hypothetical protein [Pseudomonas]|uniref:hypothetical protein n=1 Tax=Pseudomonas TaxID=286 RepID=UPI001E6173C9|nr:MULTISPECIES: hypothetical protein [Pseudomonas]MCE0871059.1 hypothetical protein [Pseudomonas alloputida]MDH1550993.1 hypothetical protein [Pseudomonas juntendi]